MTPGTGDRASVQEGSLLLPPIAPSPRSFLKTPTKVLLGRKTKRFAAAVWDFKGSSPLGRVVWGTWLESLGTFTPGSGSCCPMSRPEDSMFPCVSVQDIFFLPLLIFHDLMLESFKDQQRLLQARVFPTAGLRKSPEQSPVLSVPSGNLARKEKGPLWGKTGLFGRKWPSKW